MAFANLQREQLECQNIREVAQAKGRCQGAEQWRRFAERRATCGRPDFPSPMGQDEMCDPRKGCGANRESAAGRPHQRTVATR